MAERAPRTRFTRETDAAIRLRMAQTAGGRRGAVRRAVAELAAGLGLPETAVLKRWYRIRGRPPEHAGATSRGTDTAPSSSNAVRRQAPPPSADRIGSPQWPAADSALAGAAGHAAGPEGTSLEPTRRELAALLAVYHRAQARVAASRAALARAEGELAEAADRMASLLLPG